jgi:hypothetical protein
MTNIYLTCFHFKEIIFHTIDRIKQTTKLPHRIVVIENKSENSNQIKKNLECYLALKKIDKAYIFDNNSRKNRLKAIQDDLQENPSEYIVISDQDAYIEEGCTECWLTNFLNLLENKELQLGAVGFSCHNLQWRMKKIDKKPVAPNKSCDFTIFGPAEFKDWEIPFNEHFITMKYNYLKELYENREWIDDRRIHNFNHKKSLNSARYNKNSVHNLSCVSIFNEKPESLAVKIEIDAGYENLRENIKKTIDIPLGDFTIIK